MEKLVVAQLVKMLPSFMLSESPLPCLQEATTNPILSQMNPIHTLTPSFVKINLNIKKIFMFSD
jgi:hypothetical protein